MKVLLGAAILALVYVRAVLVLSVIAASNAAKHVAELTRLAALGGAAAAKLERVPLEDLQPLRQACRKVPHVEFSEVLAYFPAAGAERIAALPKNSPFHSQEIFGVDTERFEIAHVGSLKRLPAVDSFTEREIQSALEKTLAGRTGLIIAHRLATVRNADRIIVLQDGRIVEQGTHEALLARGGLYHRLHAMNVASFDDVPSEWGAVAADRRT